MPGERRVGIGLALGPALARGLALERVAQHRGDAVAAGVGEVEEVPVVMEFTPTPVRVSTMLDTNGGF